MENSTTNSESKSVGVRGEFDKILMRHVSSLIDTREDIAALPFNLATIACLLLLAERENEIKSFPESPPDRYNRETFFNDIEEIGIDLDEDVLVAIQNLDQYGFVVVSAKNQYTARESAALLIAVLDSIFPQMPGMNLVAYVSQSIEEVVSGRKERTFALEQFDQTLDKQGVRLSTLPKDRLPDASIGRVALQKPDPAVLLERKAAYLQRLQALRAKNLQATGDPAVVGVDSRFQKLEIQELFPRKPDQLSNVPPTGEASPIEIKKRPEGTLPDGIPFPSMPATDQTPDPDSYVDLSESEPEPAPNREVPDEIYLEDSEAETFPDEALSKEALIENKIREFEQELAMPCPICDIGKVLSDTTEKGKTYYHCSNEECRLISWGKPYHMECPVCKNPFLIETADPEGEISLKCPRATCLYRKKSTARDISSELNGTGNKNVAVVKKRGKRVVRRVVRRKS
jgi:ssDNA-binding Zn-finger/Zn-ribbon topoisomerase 1